ncbi:lasso peptide biosynthesis PqqD family chaperone [Phototrophicus methaneseepsis]|uniref:Lasso peptide biosynthesis PqqD family chaperone n=1 Tax=Phototrophicus methaneseepsis TaxID=2710758 RepID=A0A7S8EDM4_9CHLR|nr:lasso peptide biosynthesis PqqD family chaperone [Phototrophicus methaneseepsis]QPC85011.1 lasso peptide biosynthesis PqqD family chaperone [Phototrophicus methaneseepsis]
MITLKSSVVYNSQHVVATEVDQDVVILNSQSGKYFGLDEVGARVWELVQTPQRVEDIVETIYNEYDVDKQQCQEDLTLLLEQLQESGLVQVL